MQIALSAVYAWSLFRTPLTKIYSHSLADVTVAFSVAIFVLGIASFIGGVWMRRSCTVPAPSSPDSPPISPA